MENSHVLWLEHAPSFDEVKEAMKKVDFTKYKEVVFCGFGEPTEALEVLKQTAKLIKETYHMPIRINTNGLGNLVNERDIVPELKGLVDTVSISLNTPNADVFMPIEEAKSHLKDLAFTLPYSRQVKEQAQKGTLYEKTTDKKFQSRITEIARKVVEYDAD